MFFLLWKAECGDPYGVLIICCATNCIQYAPTEKK